MPGDLLLCVDLGTTRICSLVVAPDGGVLGRAECGLETRFPAPGHVEQDPQSMWDGCVTAMRQALASSGAQAGDLAALGITTQRATIVAWDPRGRPLAPAISWQDQRNADRVAALRARGVPVNTQASATKLAMWLETDGPVARAAARGELRIGCPDSWISDRLTAGGAFVTDPSAACATGLYDLAEGRWSNAACRLFGVPEELLPQVVPTAGIVGETPASLLGAPVPVASRVGDQQAAAFAQGAHQPGQAKLTLGTSAMLDVHTRGPAREVPPGTYPLALWRIAGHPDAYCLEGSVHTAGAAVDWLVDLGILDAAASADRVAGEVASTDGVAFVPAFQGLGTPWMDDGARGLIGGLTRGTTRAHLVRAALVGVAQRCTDLLDALQVDDASLPVDGGLARSNLLLQELADLSGKTVVRAGELETTALGAALLAGLAVGLLPDLAACRAAMHPGERFTPNLDRAQRIARRERWQHATRATRSRPQPPGG